MENASLIALSRQMALRRQMDVIANNVANLGTAGFKAETMVFEEHLMPQAEWSMDRPADSQVSFVQDVATVRDFSDGGLLPTGNELDVALQGPGWFVVSTPEGERYTRNGSFALNAGGELVTSEGHRVMGDGGPIVFGTEDVDIAIASDGTISSAAGDRGKLRIVTFNTEMALRPEGGSLFASDRNPAPATDARVAQGMVEKSNVQPVLEISRMIEVSRAYQSLASTLERTDRLRRDAIDSLAEVSA